MDTQEKKPWKTWILLTPVYLVIGVLMARWIIKVNSHDIKIEEDSVFAGEGRLKKKTTYYEPDLADRTYSVRYQTAGQAVASEEEWAKESEEMMAEQAKKTAQASASAKTGVIGLSVRPTSAREQEFLKKYDGAVKGYQNYLRSLGMKHYKKNPIVRQIDSEFAKMERYMAITEQYKKDRDAYKWARGVMALPEVREKVLSYVTNPKAIVTGAQIASEALKNPPPAPIYDEMMNFVTTDKQATVFVGYVSAKVLNNSDVVMTNVMNSGVDIAELQQLATQVSVGASKGVGR